MYYGFWKSEEYGLRRLGDEFLYREKRVPNKFEIFTSTEQRWMSEAITRVSEYLKGAGKI
jgi:hypothetical protein